LVLTAVVMAVVMAVMAVTADPGGLSQ